MTAEAAQHPDKAIHDLATALFGAKHERREQADDPHDADSSSESGLGKVLKKLHLKKDNHLSEHSRDDPSSQSGEGHAGRDKDDSKYSHNPAIGQWNAMRPLTSAELEEVKGYGQWGQTEPGELFLNVRSLARAEPGLTDTDRYTPKHCSR